MPETNPTITPSSTDRLISVDRAGNFTVSSLASVMGVSLKVAYANYAFLPGEVALSVKAGQSNARGFYGTSPASASDVYVMEAGTRSFSPYDPSDSNVYTLDGAANSNPLTEMVVFWQSEKAAGNPLPDLYVLNVSKGSSGFESLDPTRDLWNSNPLLHDDPVEGVVSDTISLDRTLKVALTEAISDIRGRGLTPVLTDFTWVQGEEDAKEVSTAANYGTNIGLLYDALAEITGLNRLPFYSVELVSTNYPERATVNSAASSTIAARGGTGEHVLWASNPSYDPLAPQQGIFGGDGTHYDQAAQAWLVDRIIASKNYVLLTSLITSPPAASVYNPDLLINAADSTVISDLSANSYTVTETVGSAVRVIDLPKYFFELPLNSEFDLPAGALDLLHQTTDWTLGISLKSFAADGDGTYNVMQTNGGSTSNDGISIVIVYSAVGGDFAIGQKGSTTQFLSGFVARDVQQTFVLRKTGGNITVFLNGVSQGSYAFGVTAPAAFDTPAFGRSGSGSTSVQVDLHGLIVIPTALSDVDVATLSTDLENNDAT